ncbi:hypothetical protein A0256_04110 [Mucilaginibacter sp. PAMC 26640]|nr:hypothetical protein A0256_04110 [Mucilaginibacter sp. PAMC 26640]
MVLLNKFISKLTRLNRANTVYGKAPHKPVLLISIIELIEKGIIIDNQIYVDTNLVGSFCENWQLLVSTLHHEDFTQPFYYLQSEKIDGQGFWFLKTKPGCLVNAYIRSVNTLANVIAYGYFADDIYLLLCDKSSREMIKAVLLETYFAGTKDAYLQNKQTGDGYLHNLESYILNEPEVKYRSAIVETEEEQFVRGGLFKRLVPKVYSSTCCITGMQLQSHHGHSFIDACHIVPFSLTHDDTVSNGIALCPNLHRAFDRGLVSIDNDYKVMVSGQVMESSDHPYSLQHLNGVKIKLPAQSWHHPEQANLDWHRGNVFKR